MGGYAGMRYFRSTASVYAAFCTQLDAVYGYPNQETKTVRALPALDELPTDDAGRVYLAVSREECEYAAIASMLSQALAAGQVEEIDEPTYRASLPPSPF